MYNQTMISKIHEALISLKYLKIESNVPFITLFAQFDMSSAKVIQVINCEDNVVLTVDQYLLFCKKAKEDIQDRGFEDIDFLSLIVTSDITEARKYVLNDNRCWIYNTDTMSLNIYDNEPDEFFGLRDVLDGIKDGSNYQSDSQDYLYGSDYSDYLDYRSAGRKYAGYYDGTAISTKSIFDELTLVNTIIVVINIAIFLWMTVIGSAFYYNDLEFMLNHGTMFVPSILEDREYYRFVTCMFQHFGFLHLAGNMVVLLFIGDNVERALGPIKYLILYLLSGLIGSFGSFLYAYIYDRRILSAGASGAIFGIIGAMLWLVCMNKGRLEDMTTLRVCVLIAYALFNGLTSEGIDMSAHIFGLIGGFVLAVLIYRKPKEAY